MAGVESCPNIINYLSEYFRKLKLTFWLSSPFFISRVFYKLLYGQKAYSNQQYSNNPDADLPPEKPVAERSTRRSIFGGRKESIVDDSGNPNDSKRSREESITGGLLRYSKSKKFKETKDTKLKLFLKRGSEPMLNGLPLHQQVWCKRFSSSILEFSGSPNLWHDRSKKAGCAFRRSVRSKARIDFRDGTSIVKNANRTASNRLMSSSGGALSSVLEQCVTFNFEYPVNVFW